MTELYWVFVVNQHNLTRRWFQVSYNAAGVLSHMASDGVEGWTISEPKREEVLNRIVTAIDRWDLDSKRNINYRYVTECTNLWLQMETKQFEQDHPSEWFNSCQRCVNYIELLIHASITRCFKCQRCFLVTRSSVMGLPLFCDTLKKCFFCLKIFVLFSPEYELLIEDKFLTCSKTPMNEIVGFELVVFSTGRSSRSSVY